MQDGDKTVNFSFSLRRRFLCGCITPGVKKTYVRYCGCGLTMPLRTYSEFQNVENLVISQIQSVFLDLELRDVEI